MFNLNSTKLRGARRRGFLASSAAFVLILSSLTGLSLTSETAGAATQVSSFTGEQFVAGDAYPGTLVAIANLNCAPSSSSFDFHAQGTASGPITGTFTEDGSVTWASNNQGSPMTVAATFTVSDGTGQVVSSGTVTAPSTWQSKDPNQPNLISGGCGSPYPSDAAYMMGSVGYHASFPASAAVKDGYSHLSLSANMPAGNSGFFPVGGSLVEHFGVVYLSYSGVTSVPIGNTAAVAATLVDESGAPVVGAEVAFGVPWALCTATTDSNGVASCTTPPLTFALTGIEPSWFDNPPVYWPIGLGTILQNMAADVFLNPYFLLMTQEQTVLTYTGPTLVANGAPAQLQATLFSSEGQPLVGASVVLSFGSQSCTGITDTTGTASCTIPIVSQAPNAVSVTASFAGTTGYQASQATATVGYVFAGSSFVIGKGNASVGTAVTYWGAQWSSLNTVSSGVSPSSFKGYANTSTPLVTCGTVWSTAPGNSAGPPATVSSYIAVIVTSSVTQSGSKISGNTIAMAVIKTNPGYGASPGHVGTGTVIGVFPCS